MPSTHFRSDSACAPADLTDSLVEKARSGPDAVDCTMPNGCFKPGRAERERERERAAGCLGNAPLKLIHAIIPRLWRSSEDVYDLLESCLNMPHRGSLRAITF